MPARIAVIGAGPMGLAVAYQLALDGHAPVLFEADDRIGGMSATFDFGGVEIERFYHFHCTSDLDFLQLLDELGLADRMRWVETKMGYWYQGRLQPWGNPLALLRFRGLGLAAKLRYGLHAFLATRRDDWRALDRLEASAWIRRWVGEEAWEVLWRRLFEYKFHHHARGLSAAWIWSRIRRIGRSRHDLMREKLGHLEGGSATLLRALEAAIVCRGGEIRLRSPVQQVLIEDGRVVGVRSRDEVEAFDKVISTVALPLVPQLMPGLPPALRARYEALASLAVVCVILRLRRPLSACFWLNTHDPEMDIPGLVEYSNLRPLVDPVVYVPFYLPAEHPGFSAPDSDIIRKVWRYLKKINPALEDGDLLDAQVSRCRHAQPVCGPGHRDTLPPVALPVQGLWAADTSCYYPEDRGISESLGFGRKLARLATAAT